MIVTYETDLCIFRKLSKPFNYNRLVLSDTDGSTCVAAFLPPASHLLIKVKVDQDGTTMKFTMATDNWRILPLMSDYLRTISAVEE